VAADGSGVLSAVQPADEPERHVDPGRDALARHEVPVDDVAGIAHHRDVASCRQGILETEVSRDAAAASRARLMQQ
jgi:hypothetical protein